MKQKIVILTGAGMSAESGIKTFRDADGLWEGHDVMQVASPQGFQANPELVLEFYNQRRRQLKEVEPNAGHLGLVELEKDYNVCIVTQNVDNLHERAGSTNIVHLHGELSKVRSTRHPELVYERLEDCNMGDLCEKGAQLRPHIVWFGEEVPMIARAAEEVREADIIIIIGTSMQVYPAAGLVAYSQVGVPIYYIDPKPSINHELSHMENLTVVAEPATKGVRKIVDKLLATHG